MIGVWTSPPTKALPANTLSDTTTGMAGLPLLACTASAPPCRHPSPSEGDVRAARGVKACQTTNSVRALTPLLPFSLLARVQVPASAEPLASGNRRLTACPDGANEGLAYGRPSISNSDLPLKASATPQVTQGGWAREVDGSEGREGGEVSLRGLFADQLGGVR